MPDPLHWYHLHAADVSARYETVAFEKVHGWLLDRLPTSPASILDIGAGSGRDASWLAARGDTVVAVEPSASMREHAMRMHPSPRIRWIDDRLPGLEACHALGVGFDVILLSAVWMHVAPGDRERAFRKLITLLRPGGILAISLRHGAAEPERGIHPVSTGELERLAVRYGAQMEHSGPARDELGRADVSWNHVTVRLPDDGTGAMPLLRHLIVNDAKSSTYKLALLRTLCRIADGASGVAVPSGDDNIEIPFGLVGLTWLRLHRPLLDAGLPQSPDNRGTSRLGFVGEAYHRIRLLSPRDLRIGTVMAPPMAADLYQAMRDACNTIRRMPVVYSTYPDGQPIFQVTLGGARRTPISSWSLDLAALWSFGAMRVPNDIWRCLSRYDAWIEPALIAEWTRWMHVYARSQQRQLSHTDIATAMRWSDPERDVAQVRARALTLMLGRPMHCVWTGRKLTTDSVDIDHCFPWTVWPCDSLWNLLPAHRAVNQREKRDRLPSDELLMKARDRIESWWYDAWHASPGSAAQHRFTEEARADLPGLPPRADPIALADVSGGMRIQQMRLRFNQQVAQWDP